MWFTGSASLTSPMRDPGCGRTVIKRLLTTTGGPVNLMEAAAQIVFWKHGSMMEMVSGLIMTVMLIMRMDKVQFMPCVKLTNKQFNLLHTQVLQVLPTGLLPRKVQLNYQNYNARCVLCRYLSISCCDTIINQSLVDDVLCHLHFLVCSGKLVCLHRSHHSPL